MFCHENCCLFIASKLGQLHLCENLCTQEGEQKWVTQIEKDLDRNFPTHELFGGEFGHIGKAELFRILKAYGCALELCLSLFEHSYSTDERVTNTKSRI